MTIRGCLTGVASCLAGVLLFGCAYQTGEESETEQSTEALYDSVDQVTTARLAMRDAQSLTIANGNQWEFCGLIVRKSNGQYRAGSPTTSHSQTYCGATVALSSGESVRGYYHTHPYPVQPYFSPEDVNSAEAQNRQYFLAASDGCGYWYDPTTNTTWSLGCPF